MNAKEFFQASSSFTNFEICINGTWRENINRSEIITALDRASLYEEYYKVTFWQIATVSAETIYVTLEEVNTWNHQRKDTMLDEILASMGKIDSLATA